MAGGSMKDIKRRIKSVESTGQITKAMELVASSKLRRAKERALNAGPYFTTLYQTICDISSMNNDLTSVYTKPREVKNSLFIVIAGDRGLAGGYNSNVIKLANAAIESKLEEGKGIKVIGIGKKAVEYYDKRGKLATGFVGIAEDIDQIRVRQLSALIVELYKKNEIDEACIYYTQFVSALSQVPMEMKILPLNNILDEQVSTKTAKAVNSCTYEPSAEGVFNAIVPDYIAGVLYGSIVEAFASEQGARRTAMEAANDNAKDLVDKLSLSYNRARQAAITQELSEIVSGAGAS